MINLCLQVGALWVALAPTITLSWQHSIEKILWEEDYRVEINTALSAKPTLILTESRLRGSGAGMEVPVGAEFKNGVWQYRPKINSFAEINLTLSPYTRDYTLCAHGDQEECKTLGAWLAPKAREVLAQSPIFSVKLAPCSSYSD